MSVGTYDSMIITWKKRKKGNDMDDRSINMVILMRGMFYRI